MDANKTESQLKTSQGSNCFGSSGSESSSKYAASSQTVILHRWGVKCWFRKGGVVTEPSSLRNDHKASSKMLRVSLSAYKCNPVQLGLNSVDMLPA